MGFKQISIYPNNSKLLGKSMERTSQTLTVSLRIQEGLKCTSSGNEVSKLVRFVQFGV